MNTEPRPNEKPELDDEMESLFRYILETDPDGPLRIHLAMLRAARPVVDKKRALAS